MTCFQCERKLPFLSCRQFFDQLFGESLIQLGTGVDNLTSKITEYAQGVHEVAKQTANLNLREKELEEQVSKWQETKAELS